MKLFSNNKVSNLTESINNITELIQLDEKEFTKEITRRQISPSFDSIKKSLMLLKNYENCKDSSLTGNQLVDIKILNLQLRNLNSQCDIINASKLAKKIITDYSSFVREAQDEILQTAILAKRNNIDFSFDPRKYKYNLLQSYIERYLLYIDIMEIENCTDLDSKLKLIEKLIKKHDENKESFDFFLKFISKNNITKYNDKFIIEVIEKSFKIFPNRALAYDLIKLNKSDQFEIAQEITKNINENNIEKLWFLLIMALKSGFHIKTQEIVKKLMNQENPKEILAFYYKNAPEEIPNLNLNI
ncbi:MAG: hypothetical protein LBE97_02800 [Holosporales bacterium]|jgi:hypothetical protein|nr:hypothetical protein [Holosporales bacterium]